MLNDTNSSKEEKDTFLRYLKNSEFVFLEQSSSRRENTGEIRMKQHTSKSCTFREEV